MFEQMNEQMKNAMKPMTDLAALNVNTMQTLVEKQSSMYSSLMSEGMSYFEKISQQRDVTALAQANKAYMESVQETMSDTAKSSYTILNEAQQKAGEMLKGMGQDFAAKTQSAASI
ncbi:phasin family protein [Alteromonas pelagimontana]|uniref:Phasin family protein n=1 Tax=Alteromonas pelagimontana TaxID=1858656 RepID=A0A6M4MBM3_9ALTE|nr:phasin family protein [Alteromonas pelagimontana]QJR80604.1 phasin family protein [Alteromonas pelagimontana]